MNIFFASQNKHKIDEIRELLHGIVDVQGLQDLPIKEELPETGLTLQANALQKARYVSGRFKVNCFADDTGLEVDALNGAPGVFSARYAGEGKDPLRNMEKLLAELQGKKDRKARFRTVIALIINGSEHLFEGFVEGKITETPSGEKGFGYDPVFVPDGYNQSFAEMPSVEKNAISHRGRAVAKLVEFLKEYKD